MTVPATSRFQDVLDLVGIGWNLRDLELQAVQGVPWQEVVCAIAAACSELRRLSIPWRDAGKDLPSAICFVSEICYSSLQ